MNTKTYNDIIEDWESNIDYSIDEIIKYDFDDNFTLSELDELTDLLNDRIWQDIDENENVIYTYKAKQIIDIIGIYDVFDEWEVTGERFKDFSSCAFANIYDLIQNEINIEKLIKEKL